MVDDDAIKIMLEKYRRIKVKKKEAAQEKKKNALKKRKRDKAMMRRALKAKQHRRLVMKKLHIQRQKKWRRKYEKWQRRRIIQHRYYIRHRKRPYMRRRIHSGDEYGIFWIVIMKNKKFYRNVRSYYRWRNNCMAVFHEIVEKNHSEIMCPALYRTRNAAKEMNTLTYDIIVKKKINPEFEKNEYTLRDENGVAVTIKTDNPEWVIIAREKWYVEEEFYLWGYHPKFDKKTLPWIVDNVIRKFTEDNGICSIMTWKSYVFFESDHDFTFIVTKSKEETERVYGMLYDSLNKEENVFFTGEISNRLSGTWIEKIEDKTGWKRQTIVACNPIF